MGEGETVLGKKLIIGDRFGITWVNFTKTSGGLLTDGFVICLVNCSTIIAFTLSKEK
jgi:hypothetical protein